MDEKLLLLINREWTSPGLDRFMAVATSFDVWAPLIVIALAVLLWRGSFRVRACILTAGLIVGINDGLVSKSLKSAIDRPRPHQSMNDVRTIELAKAKPRLLAVGEPLKVKLSRTSTEDVAGRSFPSSHTMNTMSAALVATAFFGLRAWWMWIIATLVGYSRIYTGSHWPSDVVTSVFIATGSTLLLLALVSLLWRNMGRRFLPAVHARHPELLSA